VNVTPKSDDTKDDHETGHCAQCHAAACPVCNAVVAPLMIVNHYELLGIPTTATTSEIDSAYRKVSKAYHPDAGGPIANATLFREATEARDVLTDPGERRKYDDWLSGRWSQPRAPVNAQPPTPPKAPTNRASPRNGYVTPNSRRRLRPRTPELLFAAILAYFAGRWTTSFGGAELLPFVVAGRVMMTLAPYLAISSFFITKSKIKAIFLSTKRLGLTLRTTRNAKRYGHQSTSSSGSHRM